MCPCRPYSVHYVRWRNRIPILAWDEDMLQTFSDHLIKTENWHCIMHQMNLWIAQYREAIQLISWWCADNQKHLLVIIESTGDTAFWSRDIYKLDPCIVIQTTSYCSALQESNNKVWKLREEPLTFMSTRKILHPNSNTNLCNHEKQDSSTSNKSPETR